MGEIRTRLADSFALIFLLDIHMERIEMQFHGFRLHGFDQFESLVAGIEEIGLKTIKRFNTEGYALGFGVLG